MFTLSSAEFLSLGGSADAAGEVHERNASLSVKDSLEVSLGIFEVSTLDSADDFVGVLEVHSEFRSGGLDS